MRLLRSFATSLGLAAMVFAVAFALAPAPAQGQAQGRGGAGGGTGSNTVAAGDFLLRLMKPNGDDSFTIFTDFDRRTYFNRARCECEETIRLELDLSTAGAAKRNQLTTSQANIEVLIGSADCVSSQIQVRQAATCQPLGKLTLGELARTRERPFFDFPISWLYGLAGGECQRRGQQNIRLRIDLDGDSIPDLVDSAAPFLAVEYDGEAPAAPRGVRVTPGNEALEVAWETNQGLSDFRGFVVLCSRAEDLQVYQPSFYTDQYRTKATVCEGATAAARQGLIALPAAEDAVAEVAASVDAGAGSKDGGTPPAMAFGAPVHFANLDPRYVCSDLLVTQTSTRLRGLQNGIPYLVGVALIDSHGNPSPIESVYMQTPIATRDFYSGYRAAGGDAEGGYCSFAPRSSGFGLGGLAVLAVGMLVMRRLARARRQR